MVETLTRPELATERALARRLRLKVTAAGGCAYCIHRLTNWGGCTAGRAFPLCMKTKGIAFEPDYDRLKGESTCTSGS
ncbi:MAG TPA: hypothetical protein VGU03_10965 [Frateuria sp.]|uniref:hypothetical protein n=1 Tax=Frateuria sp. TaxID=2211372 RepID=UPI002DE68C18|nr:hypothetical protein [Frateuria sp.]